MGKVQDEAGEKQRDEDFRKRLLEMAKECGGFVIKQDGKIESVWEWDYEADKPKRIS